MAHNRSGNSCTTLREAATSDLKDNLFDAIDKIEAPGSFAAFLGVKADLRPHIVVQDVGPIAMPLSGTQAQMLVAKAQLAPCGNVSETIVDLAEQNAWEIGPDQFDIINLDWNTYLNETLLPTIAQELGIKSPISADLYKMVLYGKGAMFRSRTATQEVPGMFGTLMVSLPSPHTGGDVIVSHCGIKKEFQTSAVDMSCVTWYSDVIHEFLPITSGYRWILTYNLHTDHLEQTPSAALIRAENRELRAVFYTWSRQIAGGSRAPTPFYFKMDHKYSAADVSIRGLKLRDKTIVWRLLDICSEFDFDLFLTTLEKEATEPAEFDGYGGYDRYYGYDLYDSDDEGEYNEERGGHHDTDELNEENYNAKIIFVVHGREIMKGVPIDKEDILQDDPFANEPDDEDYEGLMDNSGHGVTHFYQEAAIIIVPSVGVYPFLSKTPGSTGYLGNCRSQPTRSTCVTLATYYARICLRSLVKEYSLKTLRQLCEWIWIPSTTQFNMAESIYKISGQLLCQIMRVCLVHDQQELFHLFVAYNKEPIPLEFFTWYKESGQWVVSFEKLEFILLQSIESQTRISQQYAIISELSSATDDHSEEMQDLISLAVDKSLMCCTHAGLHKEDGPAVFNLALYFKDFQYLKAILCPILEKCSYTPFMLEFLKMLRQSINRKQVPCEEAMDIYRTLAKSTLLSWSFSAVTSFTAINETIKASRYMPEPRIVRHTDPKQSPFFIDYRDLVAFIASLFKFNLDEHLELLAEKLSLGAGLIKGQEFDPLYIPLLQGLLSLLEDHRIPLSTPRYQNIFQALLRAYLEIHVLSPPKKATLRRGQVCCNCGDCVQLNEFLFSTVQKIGRFNFSLGRRQHLLNQLRDAGIDCANRTEKHGSPHTLVITKTIYQQEKEKQEWEKRKMMAENNIFAFDQAKLKALLGDEYDNIVSMKCIFNEANVLAPTYSFTTSGQPRPPLAPVTGNPQDELARLQAEIARAVETETYDSTLAKAATQTRQSLMPAAGNPFGELSRLHADNPRAAMPRTSTTGLARPAMEPPQHAHTPSYSHNPLQPRGSERSNPMPYTHVPPSLVGSKRKAANVFDYDDDGIEVIEVIDLTGD